jgi:hypothetical protein
MWSSREWTLPWYFRDSGHRVAYQEGSSLYSDGSGSRLGSEDMSTYPGSGPSSLEVKPLHPALFFITSTVATMLLELCCLEEEEDSVDPPTLRVQASLYRQGPGYIVWSGCPAVGSVVAITLAWAPLSLLLLCGADRFIK